MLSVGRRERVSSKEAQAQDPFVWSVLLSSETLIARQVLVIRRSSLRGFTLADLTPISQSWLMRPLDYCTALEKTILRNPATKM